MIVIPINGQTWLICGGRDFTDADMFNSAMNDLVDLKGLPRTIVQGGAKGADELASLYTARFGIELRTVWPDWNKHGRAAGPIRNQEMLDKHKPDLVVAFPGGRGTADMVRRSRKAGVDVAEINVDVSK